MTGVPSSPWSDPATGTRPGAPYAGPPYAGPPYAGPPYAGPPPTTPYWGPPVAPSPTAWPPPWSRPGPPAAARPQRPGQVVGAAVLAFVQAAGVAVATAYVQLLGTVFSMAAGQPGLPAGAVTLADEAAVVGGVQLVSIVALVAGGVLALVRRSPPARWVLVGALGLQLALAAYWAVRLTGLLDSGVLLLPVLLFATAPAVALGLAVGQASRTWFAGRPDGGTTPHR